MHDNRHKHILLNITFYYSMYLHCSQLSHQNPAIVVVKQRIPESQAKITTKRLIIDNFLGKYVHLAYSGQLVNVVGGQRIDVMVAISSHQLAKVFDI